MLSREEVKAADAFLARLKAKAEAAVSLPQTPNANAKYTPRPEKGFPTVYGRNSTHAFDNTDIVQLTDWSNLSEPRIFVQPLLHGYYPPNITAEIASNLKATIEDLFDCVGVKVTAPIPVSKPANLDQPPYTYLVYNITSTIALELTKQHCWATKRIGFLVYPAETIMPTYLGALEGFNAHDEADMATLHKLIAETFYSTEIGLIIAQISASDPQLAKMVDADRAREVIQTLEVRGIKIKSKGGLERPVVNLYIRCPFGKDSDWTRLVEAVANAEYRHSLIGTGTYSRGWTCTMCHGADHPHWLCPFKDVPGWIEATPIPSIDGYRRQSRRAEDPNMGQQFGSRGGRGGRGRGVPTRGRGKTTRNN